MKKINYKRSFNQVLLVVGGFFLGWLFFGNSSNGIESDDHAHESAIEAWTCSMHPQIRESEAGKCPLCGMDLIPVSIGDAVAGIDQVQMSEAAIQLASIQTSIVSVTSANKDIYLSGRIEADERSIATVTSHFDGRVEKLYADFTGQTIRKGQKLANIYSPDLVTAQKELFEAMKFKETNPSFFDAAIQKLKLWELTDNQIQSIIEMGEPQYYFNIYAPRSGTIIKRRVSEGDHIKEGTVLFEIADLNSLWVVFDAYESDLPWIGVGDSISFKVKALPRSSFTGRVSFIDPTINSQTRTASVRTEILNTSGRLKPEMFVEGIIKVNLTVVENEVLVPKSAILWTGKRAIVYVKQPEFEEPTFQFREVDLGPEAGNYYIILNGLSMGEEIATNGVFKIDAAAQLQGKVSMMNPEGGKMPTGHNHGGAPENQNIRDVIDQGNSLPEVNASEETFEVAIVFKNQLNDVYISYLKVKDALIATDVNLSKDHTTTLLESLDHVDMKLLAGDARMEWMKDEAVLSGALESILRTSDVEKMREALSPLSDQLYYTLARFQVVTGGFRLFCPMAFNKRGAFWLSNSEEVLNPYYGDKMLDCGSVKEKLN